MQNQTNEKHSSNFDDILGKRNTKQDSSNNDTSKVLSKISNRKKNSKPIIQLLHG